MSEEGAAPAADRGAGPVLVVGAAIVRGGRVLAAQRDAPPRLAGFWELPGGKVEPGEGDRAALVRECREELDVDVRVGDRLAADVPIGATATLRVFTASIARGAPVALEHRDLRWLAAEEIDSVRWLPTNAPLLPALRALLAGG
ncbi:MAG: (deoxy)nucleoside triphosphate pyrophosphohydrolase [Frankiaceae bacterium]